MSGSLNLFEFTNVSFLSSPDTANKCRAELERILQYHKKVEIDFSDVYVTRGFLEQFCVPIIKNRGGEFLDCIYFANCTDATQFNITEMLKPYQKSSISSHD